MIQRINRVLIAVRNLDEGCAAFERGLGLSRGRRLDAPEVGVVTEAMPIGDAWVQVLQPVEDGPVARFLQQHGQGIYGIGVAVASLADARLRVEQCGRQAHPLHIGDNELMCLKREQLPGMTVWVTESDTGPEPADFVSPFLGIWQATSLVEDRDGAAAVYEGLFGSPTRVESFRQESYGYLGRTLYYGASPGADSLEIAQVHRTDTAMGRFWQRHGPSVYMITLDTDDMKSAREGLDRRKVRYAAETNPAFDAVYVHPSALAGSFVGIISERS